MSGESPSEGPWESFSKLDPLYGQRMLWGIGKPAQVGSPGIFIGMTERREDAEFICHARNEILEELETLRAESAQLRAIRENWMAAEKGGPGGRPLGPMFYGQRMKRVLREVFREPETTDRSEAAP